MLKTWRMVCERLATPALDNDDKLATKNCVNAEVETRSVKRWNFLTLVTGLSINICIYHYQQSQAGRRTEPERKPKTRINRFLSLNPNRTVTFIINRREPKPEPKVIKNLEPEPDLNR